MTRDPLAITIEDARALDARARRATTPCGKGHMVWRGWGQGNEAIVLLHGGSGSWVHWIRNIEAFSARYTVWVPDFPGMGESDLPPEPWTPQSIADITETGLQQLLGAQPCHMVGFSFGGMIGGHFAARHPTRVRTLVIADAAGTGVANDPGDRMKSWRRVEDAAQRKEIHRYNLGVWMLHDPARVDTLAVELSSVAVEADRLRNREVSRTDSLLQVLPQVRCPVHCIWGREDVLFTRTRAQLEALLRQAGAASILFIDDAGHWAPYEQPHAFNSAVLGILQRA